MKEFSIKYAISKVNEVMASSGKETSDLKNKIADAESKVADYKKQIEEYSAKGQFDKVLEIKTYIDNENTLIDAYNVRLNIIKTKSAVDINELKEYNQQIIDEENRLESETGKRASELIDELLKLHQDFTSKYNDLEQIRGIWMNEVGKGSIPYNQRFIVNSVVSNTLEAIKKASVNIDGTVNRLRNFK